jgi:hypothetical protein
MHYDEAPSNKAIHLGWLKGIHSDKDGDAAVVQSSSTPAGR